MKLAEGLRLAVAIVLIPFCAAAGVVFGRNLVHFSLAGDGLTEGGFALFIGTVGYIVLFVFLENAIPGTPLGRSALQGVWKTFTGYRGPRSPDRSEPRTDSEGRPVPAHLVLLPYLVPIYTAVSIAALYLLSLVFDIEDAVPLRFVQGILLGVTYTFHLFLVAVDVRKKHSDLRMAGYLFTLVLIFIFHVEILAAALMAVFREASWVDFNREVLREIEQAYRWCWDLVSRPFH